MFNFASAVSLLLCVAAVLLWVRSNYQQDRFDRTWFVPMGDATRVMDHVEEIALTRGTLKIERRWGSLPSSIFGPNDVHGWQRVTLWFMNGPVTVWGFGFRSDGNSTGGSSAFCMPLYVVPGATILLPIAWGWLHLRRTTRSCNAGPACGACGYNRQHQRHLS